jgi:hypothetical protein
MLCVVDEAGRIHWDQLEKETYDCHNAEVERVRQPPTKADGKRTAILTIKSTDTWE